MGNPASVRTGTIHPGRCKGCYGAVGPTSSRRSIPARRCRSSLNRSRPAAPPSSTTTHPPARSGPAASEAAGEPRNLGGHLSRSKPAQSTQRRSGGLGDGLEGRTPDDEAPAGQIAAADVDSSRSGHRHGNRPGHSSRHHRRTARLRFSNPDFQHLDLWATGGSKHHILWSAARTGVVVSPTGMTARGSEPCRARPGRQ